MTPEIEAVLKAAITIEEKGGDITDEDLIEFIFVVRAYKKSITKQGQRTKFLTELELHFAKLTNIPRPTRKSTYGARWVTPLLNIYKLYCPRTADMYVDLIWSEDYLVRAKNLISFTLRYMEEQGLDVKDPGSIEGVATSIYKRKYGTLAPSATQTKNQAKIEDWQQG